MDAFDHFSDDNLINSNRAMAKIKKLFRIVEIVLILVFMAWVSSHLPCAVKLFGEYFRRLVNILFSPLFIFLISNVIVLTLARHLFQQHDHDQHAHRRDHDHVSGTNELPNFDFCEEYFIKNHDDCTRYSLESCTNHDQEEHVTFQDKQTILEVTKVKKGLVRSQSENLKKDREMTKELRRSETEIKPRPTTRVAAKVDENDDDDDQVMSDEEFQRSIETFIARQIMFHKQEKLAIVLHDTTTTTTSTIV